MLKSDIRFAITVGHKYVTTFNMPPFRYAGYEYCENMGTWVEYKCDIS